MATRAARLAVPEGATVFPDDFAGQVVEFEHQGLDLFRETGDMGALQDDAFRDWSWVVYRMRTPAEMAASGASSVRVFVCRTVGPFDVEALRRDFGGGVYEIRGTFDKHLRIRHTMEVEGPRRVYAPIVEAPPPPTAPPPPVVMPQHHVADYPDDIRRRLESNERLLERLLDRMSTTPAAAATPPPSLGDILALANQLNDRREQMPTPTSETVKELLNVLRMGMDLKSEATGGPETSMAERILDRALPSLERIAVGIFTAPGRPRAPGAPAPARAGGPPAVPGSNLPTPPPVVHQPSAAVVVETPAATSPTPAATNDGAHRWPAAIEALAHAIERGDEPASFADTLDLLLAPEDLDMLAANPNAAVTAQLRAAAGGAFPVLETPGAEAFIAGVLASLREDLDGAPPTSS